VCFAFCKHVIPDGKIPKELYSGVCFAFCQHVIPDGKIPSGLYSGVCFAFCQHVTSKRWAAQQNLEKQPHFDSFLTLSVLTDNIIPSTTGTLTRKITPFQTILFDTYSP